MSNYLKNVKRKNNALIFNKSEDYKIYKNKINKEKKIIQLEKRIESLEIQFIGMHQDFEKQIDELVEHVWKLENK